MVIWEKLPVVKPSNSENKHTYVHTLIFIVLFHELGIHLVDEFRSNGVWIIGFGF